MKPRRVPEKVVEAAVVRAYTTFGCIVYKHSEPRAALATPGFPDLYVLAPRIHRHWLHEVKAAGGKLSPAQQAFRAQAEACDLTVIVGGLAEARHQLERVGLALTDGMKAA